MGKIRYVSTGIESLSIMKPLWERLREHHAEKSIHFAEGFLENTFEKRTASIVERSKNGKVNIDLAVEEHTEALVGYCISSIAVGEEAEIDSIFILPEYRGQNIGDTLLERAVAWIKSEGIEKIKISVVHGNDDVLSFYKKHGFYPRSYVLYNK